MTRASSDTTAEPDLAAAKGRWLAYLAVERREKLKRGSKPDGLDPGIIARAFATAEGKSGVFAADDGLGRIVYRITKVTVPPFSPTPAAMKALTSGLQDDLLGQYVIRLENDLGVSINEAALRSVIGADRN